MTKTTQTRESGAFTKRVGNTTYRVGVHFTRSSRETARDKIARLVRLEAENTSSQHERIEDYSSQCAGEKTHRR
jgi:hypothetical protein